MKIGIIATSLDNQNAGIHYYVKGMIHALSNDDTNEYVLIRSQKSNDLPDYKNVIIPECSWIPGFPSLRLFFIIPLVMMYLGVDAVVEPAHFGPFNLPRKIKRITIIHDLTPIIFPDYHTFSGWFLQKLFLPGILKKADLIIANSSHTQKDIESVYPFTKGKVEKIYPGVDDLFKPCFDPPVLDDYDITRPYFLFVGTIEPRKNLLLLLESYEAYRQDSININLLVLVGGDGWKNSGFYDALKIHPFKDDVRLLGYIPREHLPVLYSSTSLFIFPSIYEGFGFPVAEALSCGARCLVANNSSLKEFDFEKVTFFDLDENDALSLGMKVVKSQINQPFNRNFSWIKFGEKLILILNERLGNVRLIDEDGL